MLSDLRTAEDLKNLNLSETKEIAAEIRQTILETVSRNGGHLASNLGVVELTLAIHRRMDLEKDHLIFDVGHQCYAHKILTGRLDRFSSLRRMNGLSGFPSPEESDKDPFYSGHTGSALSQALGLSQADRLSGKDAWTVCVIGDGSLTNGMTFEALNNCVGQNDLRLMILLNDNEMSIAYNVGGFPSYLNRLRTSPGYYAFKRGLERFLTRIPLVGKGLAAFAKWVKEKLKNIVRRKTVFDDLGIPYLGTVDGNNLERIEAVIEEGKRKNGLCLIHVLTRKGQGYEPAEKDPDVYHSVPPFDPEEGLSPLENDSFSSVFGRKLEELAEKDPAVCAVTAAMAEGTGLGGFKTRFPDRFFDVGIAEEHAVTFAGGLSCGGMKPVCAVYSTFAQRGYDQLLFDICLQKKPMLLALDRAGIVPGDGKTHQGIFDVSVFSTLPSVEIWSCERYSDLSYPMERALSRQGLTVLRYPKGAQGERFADPVFENDAFEVFGPREAEDCLITYGRLTVNLRKAAEKVFGPDGYRLIRLKRIFPLPEDLLAHLSSCRTVWIAEEGVREGGIGEKLENLIRKEHPEKTVFLRALDNGFLPHGSLYELEEATGLSEEKLARWLREEQANG